MKALFAIISASLLIISCSGEKEEQKKEESEKPKTVQPKELSETELVAFLDSSIQVIQTAKTKTEEGDQLAKQFLANATILANKYKDNPKAPFYLEVSAQMLWDDQQPAFALKKYNQLINNYPDYGNMEKALYHKAVILDLDLRKKEQAVKAYQELMDRYPESIYIDDAQNRIDNIDKSIDDIVNGEQKNPA